MTILVSTVSYKQTGTEKKKKKEIEREGKGKRKERKEERRKEGKKERNTEHFTCQSVPRSSCLAFLFVLYSPFGLLCSFSCHRLLLETKLKLCMHHSVS
jgi:hypothetical protein